MLEGIEIDVWRPLAGLMIFLLAMGLIENAIKALAGNKVKQVIARNTDRPISGVLTGTIATALLQSSSLVGLLVLAFVGARIMVLKTGAAHRLRRQPGYNGDRLDRGSPWVQTKSRLDKSTPNCQLRLFVCHRKGASSQRNRSTRSWHRSLAARAAVHEVRHCGC